MNIQTQTNSDVVLALEDESATATDSKTQVELEHVFYVKISDLDQLKNAATSVDQEQWSIQVKNSDAHRYGGSIRVRAINGESFAFCIKSFEKGKRGGLENEFQVGKDVFEQFKRLSNSGMVKTRYTFPIEGTEYAWEVDIYKMPDGSPAPWAKIDLEVKDADFQIPELPIKCDKVVRDQPHNRTPDLQTFIDHVMSTYLVTKNQYMVPESDPE